MDDERFDTLTRALGSRRTVLGGLLGSVAALIGLAADEAEAHNPAARCRKLRSRAKRRRCLRRARAHNRKHRCKSKPPSTICGGRCGGTKVNNCGKRVRCPGCPAGKTCLGNGSCAQSCPLPLQPGCPAGCTCLPDIDRITNRCVLNTKTECEQMPLVCTSAAQCPLHHFCLSTLCGNSGNFEGRCLPLCPS